MIRCDTPRGYVVGRILSPPVGRQNNQALLKSGFVERVKDT